MIPDRNKKLYSHAIPIEHNLSPGPLWEWKHTAEELRALEEADSYNYHAQYRQAPAKKGGNMFLTEWWRYYSVIPEYEWKAIFADTALKDGQLNDYTVFQCWAKYQGRIYLLDQYRQKIKSTELENVFTAFWNKHSGSIAQPLRAAYVEDKASGIQLIQQIQKNGGIPIIPIPRNKGMSKLERAVNLVSWIKSGLLVLPEEAVWLYDYITEFERFSPLMTHKHDDQIDPTLDAIEHMLIQPRQIKTDDSKAKNNAIAPHRDSKIW